MGIRKIFEREEISSSLYVVEKSPKIWIRATTISSGKVFWEWSWRPSILAEKMYDIKDGEVFFETPAKDNLIPTVIKEAKRILKLKREEVKSKYQ